ncbi:hypothetical protein CEB3_c19960 [Peptococcaceae bacterium CEB3]|nr:hypothetical protein CEB3_c19960 [Peptococcaceae bacterium CEB3]
MCRRDSGEMGVSMKGLIAYTGVILWYILVLMFTTKMLLPINIILYFVITIPLLIIPTTLIKKYLKR